MDEFRAAKYSCILGALQHSLERYTLQAAEQRMAGQFAAAQAWRCDAAEEAAQHARLFE